MAISKKQKELLIEVNAQIGRTLYNHYAQKEGDDNKKLAKSMSSQTATVKKTLSKISESDYEEVVKKVKATPSCITNNFESAKLVRGQMKEILYKGKGTGTRKDVLANTEKEAKEFLAGL
jgi:DNA-binding MurR/RpiR family transcriptional regulator